MSFVLGLIIGFFFGVVVAMICLCKKNLEKYEKIRIEAEQKYKDSMGLAKATYNYYSKSPEEREAESEISEKS